MTLRKLILTAAIATAPVLLAGQGQTQSTAVESGRPRSGNDRQAARRFVADLFGRLHRPALQHADADQPDDRQEPHARVGRTRQRTSGARPAAAGSAASAAVAAAVAAAPAHHRRRRPGRCRRRGGGATIKGAMLQVERRALRVRARQRVGARRARRPRAVALLLEDEGQHAHRQPRRRHVAQQHVRRDAGRLPRLARREERARKAGTSRSPASRSSTSRRWRRSSSATT